MRIGWLARGQIHIRDANGTIQTFTSEYGERARSRAAKSAQKNAWKLQGPSAMFGGGAPEQAGTVEVPLFVTGLSRAASGDLIYSLETRDVGGLFSIPRGGGAEDRLFHAANQFLRDPAVHPQAPVIACAIPKLAAFTSHLGVLGADGNSLMEVTEGDSVDRRPSWSPTEPRVLVFESAGVGRDAAGAFVELAPSVIQRLDVKTGELTTLAEEPGYDLCSPKLDAEGALYFVRRPQLRSGEVPFWRMLVAFLMIPFRIIGAILGWLNFFTLRYSGKSLTSGGNARARQADLKQMMLWGNFQQVRQAAFDGIQEEQFGEVRAPKSWELVRRPRNGAPETIARGVAVFDLGPEGQILYTDGVDLFLKMPGRDAEKVAKDVGIQQVVWLGS